MVGLWGGAYCFFRTGIIPLDRVDLSEIEIIDREREAEEFGPKLAWYRVLA